jgi:hypothetical protein
MQFRTLKTATAVLAATVGVSAFAGSAQAAVFQNQYFYLDRDPDGEVSLMDGNVANDWSHSTISPHVTGTFKVVSGDDANFRVRVDSRDSDDDVIGTTYYTPRPNGFKNDGEHDFAVDMYATPAPNIADVEIAVEKLRNGTWKEKDHWHATVFTSHDDVKILDTGIDVGGSSFDAVAHEPFASATVNWDIEDDGRLTAKYHGFLHLESNFYPGVARVQIRALNDAGKVLATATGDAHYQNTPAYTSGEDELSVTTADATRLKVKIQKQDQYTHDWIDLPGDEQIVNVAD